MVAKLADYLVSNIDLKGYVSFSSEKRVDMDKFVMTISSKITECA